MIGLGDIVLLRPYWLVALPVIALLVIFAGRRHVTLGAWTRAVDPALMAALGRLGWVVPGTAQRRWLPALTAVLIALALVGPARETRDIPTFRNLDGLVLVIDLSRSVAEGGVLPRTLTAARLVANHAGSRPVAVVVFAGDAYLASAFSTDIRVLGQTIALLDGETVPDSGSRPDRGLALAAQTLRGADIIAGDVVLLSDGGGVDDAAAAEAEAIVAAGSRLSTLFIDAPRGREEPDRPPRAALDRLAHRGGGVAGDIGAPLTLAETAGRMSAERLAKSDLAVLFWSDYGRYLLLLVVPAALALFRRRA